jgi:DNA-binding Lrp family transcriptional regulator
MFGQPDYLLRVGVKDLAGYERLHMTRLTGLPGVVRASSRFTMRVIKS